MGQQVISSILRSQDTRHNHKAITVHKKPANLNIQIFVHNISRKWPPLAEHHLLEKGKLWYRTESSELSYGIGALDHWQMVKHTIQSVMSALCFNLICQVILDYVWPNIPQAHDQSFRRNKADVPLPPQRLTDSWWFQPAWQIFAKDCQPSPILVRGENNR